jgi:hypothetical protein
MKQVAWDDRAPGDVGLVRLTDLMGDLIVDFEREMHPEYHGQFIPSHAFIAADHDMVIEASLRRTEDSVAAINPASEYEHLEKMLWRIDRTETQVEAALKEYLREYAGEGYGFLNLLGFALEAMGRHLGNPKARNPILLSYICSQGVLLFLRLPSNEKWPATADLRDCDPLALQLLCIANETTTAGVTVEPRQRSGAAC